MYRVPPRPWSRYQVCCTWNEVTRDSSMRIYEYTYIVIAAVPHIPISLLNSEASHACRFSFTSLQTHQELDEKALPGILFQPKESKFLETHFRTLFHLRVLRTLNTINYLTLWTRPYQEGERIVGVVNGSNTSRDMGNCMNFLITWEGVRFVCGHTTKSIPRFFIREHRHRNTS